MHDQRPAFRVVTVPDPRPCHARRNSKSFGCVMKGTHELANRTQLVRPCERPPTIGQERFSFEERQDLTAAFVNAKEPRRSLEADALEMFEQRVHGGRPGVQRATHGVADTHDALIDFAPLQRDFLVGHPASLPTPPAADGSARSLRET